MNIERAADDCSHSSCSQWLCKDLFLVCRQEMGWGDKIHNHLFVQRKCSMKLSQNKYMVSAVCQTNQADIWQSNSIFRTKFPIGVAISALQFIKETLSGEIQWGNFVLKSPTVEEKYLFCQTLTLIFAQNKTVYFVWHLLHCSLLGRDLLMTSMERRDDYSNQFLLLCTFSIRVLY